MKSFGRNFPNYMHFKSIKVTTWSVFTAQQDLIKTSNRDNKPILKCLSLTAGIHNHLGAGLHRAAALLLQSFPWPHQAMAYCTFPAQVLCKPAGAPSFWGWAASRSSGQCLHAFSFHSTQFAWKTQSMFFGYLGFRILFLERIWIDTLFFSYKN